MIGTTSLDFLNTLLAGNEPTPQDIDDLIRQQPKEDEYLDFKDGKLTDDRKEAARVVRAWVNGFANAVGGTLVVGVSEGMPRTVTGAKRIGGAPLDQWAKDVVADMAPYFSPLPRFRVVTHSAGEVLTVAVARAPQLVPCAESRELKYYLRFHDSTLEVPEYLLADLVLGRRQQPQLSAVRIWANVDTDSNIHDAKTGQAYYSFKLSLELVISNDSLVDAIDVDIGMIGWSLEERKEHVSGQLLAHINTLRPKPEEPHPFPWQLIHRRNTLTKFPPPSLRPFASTATGPLGSFHLPRQPGQFKGALYLLPRGARPLWFEVEFDHRVTVGTPQAAKVRAILGRPETSWTRS